MQIVKISSVGTIDNIEQYNYKNKARKRMAKENLVNISRWKNEEDLRGNLANKSAQESADVFINSNNDTYTTQERFGIKNIVKETNTKCQKLIKSAKNLSKEEFLDKMEDIDVNYLTKENRNKIMNIFLNKV